MRIIGISIVIGTVLMATTTAAAAPSAAGAKDEAAGQPVAMVNGVAISQADFDRNWEYFLQRSGIPANHADKSGQVNEFRQQVVERLVDEELLFQESKRRKLSASNEQVDAEVEKAHAQFPTPEAFSAALERNRLTEPGLRTVFTRNLSIESLVEKEIAKSVTVSDAEVHDFYVGNKASFEAPAGTVPEAEAAGQIRDFLVSKKTGAAVEERLKKLRADARIELLMKF